MRNETSFTRAQDWDHWFYLHRADTPKPRKSQVAQQLGVSPSYFSKLLDPQRYRPLVDEETVQRIAVLWNQSPDYVRKVYPRAA